MGTFPRETSYKAEYCEMLIDHMSSGLSYECFGAIVDCGKQTLYDWEKRYPEWKKAKAIAFSRCQLYWEKMGRDGIEKGTRDFNGAVWNFNMSARFKWSMKNENAVTVSRLEDLLGSNDTIEAQSSEITHAIEHDEDIIEIEPINVNTENKVKSDEV